MRVPWTASRSNQSILKEISPEYSLEGLMLKLKLQNFGSVTPWTAARQASLSITNSQSLLKPMSIESVMPSNHLILCHPLLLLPSIPPSRPRSHPLLLPSVVWTHLQISGQRSPLLQSQNCQPTGTQSRMERGNRQVWSNIGGNGDLA